jgi:hypothetical protein
MAALSGTRGLWQPSGWRGRGGSKGTISSHKASGIRQLLSWIIWPIALLQSCLDFFKGATVRPLNPPYRDRL